MESRTRKAFSIAGSAVMQQFIKLIGEDNFFQGLKNLIDVYQYSNADLKDLFNEFQQFYQNNEYPIQQWIKDWIETPSHNVLIPILNKSNGSFGLI